jgi:hypothetical protein
MALFYVKYNILLETIAAYDNTFPSLLPRNQICNYSPKLTRYMFAVIMLLRAITLYLQLPR